MYSWLYLSPTFTLTYKGKPICWSGLFFFYRFLAKRDIDAISYTKSPPYIKTHIVVETEIALKSTLAKRDIDGAAKVETGFVLQYSRNTRS